MLVIPPIIQKILDEFVGITNDQKLLRLDSYDSMYNESGIWKIVSMPEDVRIQYNIT